MRINGFYGHVRRNDLRSFVMFAGFTVAFQIVAAVALFPALLVFDIRHAPLFPLGYLERYVPLVALVSVLLFIIRFSRHVASVQANVAFTYVDRRTDARLVNIVETQAIAAGLPFPKVGVIETTQRNAFACGLRASSAVVVVTRGLTEALDDDELTAVVAHEVAHIKNGDIRLMAAAKVLMENLEWLQHKNLLRGIGWKMALVVVLMPALLLLFAMAGVLTRAAFTIARVSRLLISSSREFIADAEAVRLTHHPAALISALRKIEGRSTIHALGPEADAMMIDGAVEGPFATHPTIADRVAVLMRLSGKWAEAETPRKDTRVSARGGGGAITTIPPSGPWGKANSSIGAVPPARFLFQRVNAGAKENLYGVTPTARWVIGIGMALLVGSTFFTIAKFDRAQKQGDAERRREVMNTAGIGPKDGLANDPSALQVLRTKIRTETQRLSKLDPLEAGCFATTSYWVSDRGLHKLTTPDPRLIEAYARPDPGGSSSVVLERYLGWRLQSLRRVAEAQGSEIDQALVSYVNTRKATHEVMHRFFGIAGLDLIRQVYASPEDSVVIEKLKQRVQGGAPLLTSDSRVAAESRLLMSEPEEFIPCLARASSSIFRQD
jgi:Zn-dependent protease with chaperone function